MITRTCAALALVAMALLSTACDGRKPVAADQEAAPRQVVFANWEGEIGPTTHRDFEQATGIRVVGADLLDNVTLQTQLLAGNSGYDVVVPGSNFIGPLIGAGALQPLDRSRLPNWRHLDRSLLALLEKIDPGNRHGVPYLWGTQGFAYNYGRLREVLGRNPEPSWKLLFDPAITGRLRDCGIAWQDGAGSIMADLALLAIGADPAAEDLAALARAEAALLAVRGDVRYIDNSNRYRSDLASGEICIATGPSGDLVQARELARTSGSGADLRYVIPLEGGLLWVDLLAIPVDAPDPEAAHILINYLLEPAVIARVTTASRYANANRASDVWLEPRVRGDPAIYPEAMAFERLRLVPSESLEYTRERTRMWTRVRTAAGATAPD